MEELDQVPLILNMVTLKCREPFHFNMFCKLEFADRN